MKIGFGYARRAATVPLALAGLVILTDPLQMRNEMISTAAHADEIRKIGNVCNWDNLDWDEMSGSEKLALGISRMVPRSVGLGQLRGGVVGERLE